MAFNTRKLWKLPAATLVGGLVVGVSGCDGIPAEYQQFFERLKKEAHALVVVLQGGQSPLGKKAQPAPTPSTQAEFSSDAAKRAKENAELLHEMVQVVLMREPADRSEFGNLLDSLNQGASLEGIYNGLTHSADYRKLETANTGSSAEALRVFSEELALLEIELPEPTEFDSSSAQPLARPVMPTGEGGARGGSSLHSDESAAPSAAASAKPDPRILAEKYGRVFVGASIYTLKRVLADEALKVVSAKRQLPERLALWYSKWAVRLSERRVDFGISQRNLADEAFHYKWVTQASEDRLIWETLNRVHRILNEANRLKQ